MAFPLATATPSSLGFDVRGLERLQELITRHLAEGRYPAAQIAVARDGKLALVRSFGDARLDPVRVPAREDSLWLLYSNTKVITACAVWILAEQGALRFTDRVADHVPGFEANGKGDITIIQLLSHQGGFPERGRAERRLGGPRAAAPDGLGLHARVDARLARALPRPRRALGGRGAHRGAQQDGLPGVHPGAGHRAARARRGALRGPAGRATTTGPWTCTSPRRPGPARGTEGR